MAVVTGHAIPLGIARPVGTFTKRSTPKLEATLTCRAKERRRKQLEATQPTNEGDIEFVDLEVNSEETMLDSRKQDEHIAVKNSSHRECRAHTSGPRKQTPDRKYQRRPSTTGTGKADSNSARSRASRTSTPGLKRTIVRSARRTRPNSTISAAKTEGGAFTSDSSPERGCHSDGDTEERPPPVARATGDAIDFGGIDIYGETGWDTDLEGDTEEKEAFDVTGRTVYLESCRLQGVIPASYFLRHMSDTSLEMKHHGLGPQGTKPISVALVSNTHVLKLNLTDNWLGSEGGKHICEMLKENCYIYDLDLSDNGLDAKFAEKFTEVLTTNTTLTHITLSGNVFNDAAAIYLAEAIMHTTKLEYLNLSKNKLGEMAGVILAPAISENSSIKHLDLSWNSIRRKGAVAIAAGIKQNVLMQKINLSMNGMGNEGCKALGDALKVNSALEELDITNNRITTEGAVLLGKGLSVNETLKVLKIGKNPMQSAGCYAVCAALVKNPGPAMERIDFTDILVNNDFLDMSQKLRELLPDIKLRTGNDGVPKRPKARVHPMVKLKNYIDKNKLRLVDFFNALDEDRSMSVTREEFAQGIEESGIRLNDEEITELLNELDRDGDGEINYSELVIGHQEFTEKEQKMAATIMSLNNGENKLWQQ